MSKFRSVFAYDKPIIWYPTHQSKALKQLKNGIHHIDLVIEVRDARIPLTSINPQFDEVLGRRERMIVYNKADLANTNMRKPLVEALKKYRGEECLFTTANKGFNVKTILDRAIAKCQAHPTRYPFLSLVVVGMPNVGKSTIINSLRAMGVHKGKVTAVGKKAGVTRTIQTRVKIYEDPPIYLVDTPGIFDPLVSSPAQGLKISLVGSTNDSLTTMINVADYLLFRLNHSHHQDRIVQFLGLTEPSDDIYKVLEHIALSKGYYIETLSRIFRNTPRQHVQEQTLDIDRAATYFVEEYRKGTFGPMTLDDCSPHGLVEFFTGTMERQEIRQVPH